MALGTGLLIPYVQNSCSAKGKSNCLCKLVGMSGACPKRGRGREKERAVWRNGAMIKFHSALLVLLLMVTVAKQAHCIFIFCVVVTMRSSVKSLMVTLCSLYYVGM